MRLFIAIEIPDGIKQEIARVQQQLKKAGAEAGWTRPEGIHLTLKFLGEVPETRVSEIMASLENALRGTPRFRLEVMGAGAFPSVKSPRVLWLGMAGELDKLVPVQEAVERAMAGLGFAREDRKFSPHLTLARIRSQKPRDNWQQAIAGISTVQLGGFAADRVVLMKSELKPSGAVYVEAGRVALE